MVTYNDFFDLPFIQTVVNENKLKLIIYNLETEEVDQWIS
ncbi:MAG: element excision factor XisH family protein [Nostoc sp.]